MIVQFLNRLCLLLFNLENIFSQEFLDLRKPRGGFTDSHSRAKSDSPHVKGPRGKQLHSPKPGASGGKKHDKQDKQMHILVGVILWFLKIERTSVCC